MAAHYRDLARAPYRESSWLIDGSGSSARDLAHAQACRTFNSKERCVLLARLRLAGAGSGRLGRSGGGASREGMDGRDWGRRGGGRRGGGDEEEDGRESVDGPGELLARARGRGRGYRRGRGT